LVELIQDARRFIMYHKWAIENHPLQAYASALTFSPAGGVIRGLFNEEELKWITIKPAMEDKWSACLQTLEGNSHLGHSDSVMSVAFSHDSARLASASYDKTVKVWGASSGECVQTLKGHGDSVKSVAFSHDSARLASASPDKTVKVWDASSGKCLQTFGVGKALPNISFDTTGSYLRIEIGTIIINACASTSNITPSVMGPQNPQYQGGGLSSDGAWITYNSENLVWLPSEYRPSGSVVSGKTIGMGVGYGKVWICNVELSES
ncbi:WD40 repeat-like protein, partial [Zopfia rhizophila CBS 207.26]